MSLPTPSQSVSHKWLHHCVNYKKKSSLRYHLQIFGIWLGVDKVLQKLAKSYMCSDIHFNVASWFPGNVRVKLHFNTQCRPPPLWSRVYYSVKKWLGPFPLVPIRSGGPAECSCSDRRKKSEKGSAGRNQTKPTS